MLQNVVYFLVLEEIHGLGMCDLFTASGVFASGAYQVDF